MMGGDSGEFDLATGYEEHSHDFLEMTADSFWEETYFKVWLQWYNRMIVLLV